MNSSSLFLIDGHSLIYRAFFAIRGLSTSKGVPTNAAYGFTNMLLKLFRDKQPEHLAIALDSKGSTQRHAEFEEYKAQRPEMPDSLQQQLPIIHQIISAFRIPVLMMEGYEADDLIGTLSKHAEKEGMDVTIVTGDKDLFQLIGPKVHVYDTMKDKTYNAEDVLERFGVEPAKIIEIMGLMGDTVDNIPGVPGIGEKTAVKLIREFQTIENLLKNLNTIRQNKIRKSLEENSDLARKSRELATLRLDCPITLNLKDYKRNSPSVDLIIPLFQELEFTALLKRLDELQPGAPTGTHLSPNHAAPVTTTLVTDQPGLSSLIEKIQDAGRVVIELFEKDKWTGVSVFVKGSGYYISIRQQESASASYLPKEVVASQLAKVLEDAEVRLIGHHLKDLILGCMSRQLTVKNLEFDTEIASYLLNPSRRDHSLETVTFEYLGRRLAPLPSQKDKPPATDQVAGILAARARSTFELFEKMAPLLTEQQLDSLLRNIEMPLIPVLAEMEQTGIMLNTSTLSEISKELDGQLGTLTKRIYDLAREPFNINSPKQLSKILFERLGLTPLKKTKTGYSTNEEVLQQLAIEHELPGEILNYRQISKLKSTYVDALPELVDSRTGRLHTSFNQTATATGRLSSSDPNLQNIPIKGEWGKRIRTAFVAENGYQLMSFDYNQIELRILAHLSGDEKLLADFKRGHDVHRSTASKIFGLPETDITTEMRRTAKTVNFGIVYGISPYGLSSALGIPQNEAKVYIDSYFAHYSGVKQFIDQTIEEASTRGFVTTLFHRRRPIPELASPDRAGRSLGERTAVNTVIQGSAADMIKLAMIRIYERIRNESLKTRMLLQIHDELLFETSVDHIEDSRRLITGEMEGVMALRVPLKVDVGIGENWSTAHP